MVGRAPRAEPGAEALHLPALRSATRCDQRARAARSGGRSEPAPTRARRLRCAGPPCGQSPNTRRVAREQAVLTGRAQAATPWRASADIVDVTCVKRMTTTSHGRTDFIPWAAGRRRRPCFRLGAFRRAAAHVVCRRRVECDCALSRVARVRGADALALSCARVDGSENRSRHPSRPSPLGDRVCVHIRCRPQD